MSTRPHAARSNRLRIAVYLAIALAFRAGELWRGRDNLLDDRDAYLAIARTLAAGHGFRSSPEAAPTAFRPPLYPCVLAGGISLFQIDSDTGLKLWIGGLNLLMSLATVLLTVRLARRWFGETSAALVWIWVCFDPLLIHNITLPMTETMFALLLVGLFNSFETPGRRETASTRRRWVQGILFGLCALCRPTIWPFGLLWGAWALARGCRSDGMRAALRRAVPSVLGAAAIIAPWIVRNALVFGEFIPMTTHGGYTLLLANNEVFDEEVVSRSWRQVWSGESLSAWQNELERRMAAEGIAPDDEPERDRWMSRAARTFIVERPDALARGCVVRLLRFWNVVPLTDAGQPVSSTARLILLTFYGGLFGSVLLAVATRSDLFVRMLPIWCAILCLSAVHAVYWSNMRMRTPLEPLLAALAASCLGDRARGNPTEAASGSKP